MTLTDTELALLVAGIALGGVVIGGVIAGLLSLWTDWLASRRDHRRWMKEQLLDAVLRGARLTSLQANGLKPKDAEIFASELADMQARLGLVTTKHLTATFSVLLDHALRAQDPNHPEPAIPLSNAQAAYFAAARKSLGLPKP